jgi:hypothetical protein
MLIFAVIVAAMLLVWQKPDDVPESAKDSIPLVPPGDLWERLMAAPTANAITLSEEDINNHVRRSIKAGEGAAGVKFVRSVIGFKPGVVTVFVERDFWGLPMYSSVSYKPVVKSGKVSGEIIGVRIGRLGIHPSAASYVSNWAVSGLWNAFEKEIKQADRLSEVRVEDGKVMFISKPL